MTLLIKMVTMKSKSKVPPQTTTMITVMMIITIIRIQLTIMMVAWKDQMLSTATVPTTTPLITTTEQAKTIGNLNLLI